MRTGSEARTEGSDRVLKPRYNPVGRSTLKVGRSAGVCIDVNDSILQRIAQGDQLAVNECIDTYGGLVWSLARQFSENTAEAEDAVQEIFVNIWQTAERYDPDVAKEATFIAMIARRRLIDRRRKRQRRPESASVSSEVVDESSFATESLGEAKPMDEDAERAMAALEQLRPQQRRVLQLAIGRGCTYEQIASVTDMPLGTVKTHARRGLIQLRKLLASDQQSGQEIVT